MNPTNSAGLTTTFLATRLRHHRTFSHHGVGVEHLLVHDTLVLLVLVASAFLVGRVPQFSNTLDVAGQDRANTPTPDGVPVKMMSPGSSGQTAGRPMSSGTAQTFTQNRWRRADDAT